MKKFNLDLNFPTVKMFYMGGLKTTFSYYEIKFPHDFSYLKDNESGKVYLECVIDSPFLGHEPSEAVIEYYSYEANTVIKYPNGRFRRVRRVTGIIHLNNIRYFFLSTFCFEFWEPDSRIRLIEVEVIENGRWERSLKRMF